MRRCGHPRAEPGNSLPRKLSTSLNETSIYQSPSSALIRLHRLYNKRPTCGAFGICQGRINCQLEMHRQGLPLLALQSHPDHRIAQTVSALYLRRRPRVCCERQKAINRHLCSGQRTERYQQWNALPNHCVRISISAVILIYCRSRGSQLFNHFNISQTKKLCNKLKNQNILWGFW